MCADRRLRALIYNRASADSSRRAVSVSSQEVENRAWCDREGWEIAGVVTDNDRSASRWAAKHREGYDTVQRAFVGETHGRVDVLVCWESSRANRDLATYVPLRDLCAEHGVLFAYKGRVFDMREGDDRFTTGLDALLDEREAERARERTMRSHRDSVAHGKPRGVTPFGYRREYEPGSNRLLQQVPDPESAAVVAELAAAVLDDVPLYRIAQDLNARGVITPRGHRDRAAGRDSTRPGWSASMIRNLLSKPSLMGMRTHHGLTVGPGTWEAIVSPADWAKVQAILGDPARGRQHSGVAPRHLLSGVATCGVCGAWMRPLLNRGRMTYVCGGRVPTDGKGHVGRDKAQLDAFVTLTVASRMARPDFAAVFTEAAQPARAADEAAQELADVRARLAEFEASAAAGGISAASFGRIEAGLREQIADLERRSVPVVMPPAVAVVAGPDALAEFARLSLLDQREVIRALCSVEVLRVTRRGVRSFDPSSVRIVWRTQGGDGTQ